MKEDKNILPLSAVMSIVLAGTLALSLAGCGDSDEEERGEQKVAIEQVPPAVKATIELERHGATVKEVEKINADGKTAYAADIVTNGKERKIFVGEDGKVIPGHGRGDKDDD